MTGGLRHQRSPAAKKRNHKSRLLRIAARRRHVPLGGSRNRHAGD